jgi:ribose transport system substrate-binding protein
MTTTQSPAPAYPSDAPHRRHTGRRTLILLLLLIIAAAAVVKFSGAFASKPRIALVTASQGPYWDAIIAGAKEAARRNDADLDVITPSPAEQERAIRSLIGKGYAGVAVSPNDPLTMAAALADVTSEAQLVTFDADCPIARRLCYIATDNYDAGHMAGQLVRGAIPEGGEVLIAVGSMEKENAQRRRQGLIDELLDRPFEREHATDPIDATLKGSKYAIAATLVDGIEPAKADALAAEALRKYPNAKCIVGLFAYNTPVVLKVLERTGKLKQVKVVGFDAYAETLDGIENDSVYGAVLQDPHFMGFEAVRILADVAHGNRQAVPLFQTRSVTCESVTKQNLPLMRKTLAAQGGGAPLAAPAAPTAAPESLTTQPAAQ